MFSFNTCQARSSGQFWAVPGPLDRLTPAAAVARLKGGICEWIYVYGENGEVRAVQAEMPTK